MKRIFLILSFTLFMHLNGNDMKLVEKTWIDNDISITARLEQDKYRFYEPILLKIIYKNNSQESIHLTLVSSKIRYYEFQIMNETLQGEVPYTLKGKSEKDDFFPIKFGRSTLPIKSNSEYVHEIYLNGYYDLTLRGKYCLSMNSWYFDSNGKTVPIKIENLEFEIIDDLKP